MGRGITYLYVYILKNRKKELERAAEERGTPVSALTRIIIDDFLEKEALRKAAPPPQI